MSTSTNTIDSNEIDGESKAPSQVTFIQALKLWFKLGFLGFGGPAAQISLMHRELVEQRRWISAVSYTHLTLPTICSV